MPERPATWLAVILMVVAAEGEASRPPLTGRVNGFQPRAVALDPAGLIALFENLGQALTCARMLGEGLFSQWGRIILHVGECDRLSGRPVAGVYRSLLAFGGRAPSGQITITSTTGAIMAGLDEISLA